MSSFRLALRLARREVLRRKGRTALVALLIAIPVAGMTSATTLIRSDRVDEDQEWQNANGQADAIAVDDDVDVDSANALGAAPVVPAGSRSLTVRRGWMPFRTADRSHRSNGLEVTDLDLRDPLAVGYLTVLEGRVPSGPGEMMLSRAASRDLGAEVGDVLALGLPEGRFTVVGLVERPSCLGCALAAIAPGAPLGAASPDVLSTIQMIDLPADVSEGELDALRAGSNVQLRVDALTYVSDDQGEAGVRWSLVIGAVVLMVVGIVISAAFAVGARRQLVTLGQLSASGASPNVLRAMLVLQGSVTGLIGALGGMAFAQAALHLFQGPVEGRLGKRFANGLVVRPSDLVAALLVGLAAATLAALIPARAASGIPTLTALAGRRPQAAVKARLVMWGVIGVVIGLGLQGLAVLGGANQASTDVWAFVAIVGGVSELLGACALSPAIVSRLEPFAGRLRGPWRIGARSLARNRTRTGAVVSAVCAAGALAIVATGLWSGIDARDRREELNPAPENVYAAVQTSRVIDDASGTYDDDRRVPSAAVVVELDRILPTAERSTVRVAELAPTTETSRAEDVWTVDDLRDSSGYVGAVYPGPWAVIADSPVLDAIGLDQRERSALADHGVALLRGRSTNDTVLHSPDGTRTPVVVVQPDHRLSDGGETELLVTEAAAQRLGLVPQPGAYLFHNPRPLGEAQRDQLGDLSIDSMILGSGAPRSSPGTESSYLEMTYFDPSFELTPLQLELLLSGVALLFALFVVGASLALAAAESKDERDVLTVAGAAPGVLARAAGAKAVLLAATGALLAVPIGYLPVIVASRAATGGLPLIFPIRIVLLLVVVVPAIVGLASWASSALAQRVRPVRVSTAVFD